MKKQFEDAVVEVIQLQVEDVICTSGGGFTTEPYGEGGSIFE